MTRSFSHSGDICPGVKVLKGQQSITLSTNMRTTVVDTPSLLEPHTTIPITSLCPTRFPPLHHCRRLALPSYLIFVLLGKVYIATSFLFPLSRFKCCCRMGANVHDSFHPTRCPPLHVCTLVLHFYRSLGLTSNLPPSCTDTCTKASRLPC